MPEPDDETSSEARSSDIESRQPDPRVGKYRPDPAQPATPMRSLQGFWGDSDRPGFRRLYFSASLDSYAEFRVADVLDAAEIPPDRSPFPGEQATRVTLRRDAPVDITHSRPAGAVDAFDLDIRVGSRKATHSLPNLSVSDPCLQPEVIDTSVTCATCARPGHLLRHGHLRGLELRLSQPELPTQRGKRPAAVPGPGKHPAAVPGALIALVPRARRQPGRWTAAVTPTRRSAAITAALDVGIRITDPDRIRSAVQSASSRTSYPRTVGWAAYDVAQGDAGLALLCAQLDACFPGDSWDVRAHDLLASAARAAERVEPPPGLFSGLSGIALVTHLLSRDGTRYQRLTRAIDEALLPRSLALAQSARERSPGLAFGHFDVISGLAGIGACLLTCRDRDPVGACLERVLGTLVEIVLARDGCVPAWFTPRELLGEASLADRYPQGVLNCGLAHGIPGVVALHGAGPVPGRGRARPERRDRGRRGLAGRAPVRRRVGSQLAHRDRAARGIGSTRRAARAAWCYGSPGVARALWLAGSVLGDETSLRGARGRRDGGRLPAAAPWPATSTLLRSATAWRGCCRSYSALRTTPGCRSSHAAAADLAGQLLGAYRPDSLLGFCSARAGRYPGRPARPARRRARSVALVLLAAATIVPPAWDRLFLLA